MSYCGSESGSKCKSNCVCDVVRGIVIAQNKVNDNNTCCSTSCEQSIEKLLSPGTTGNGNGANTIPFTLFCKGKCDLFVGTGIYRDPTESSPIFKCIETPVFRAKSFLDNKECCVRLELLVPVNGSEPTSGSGEYGACGFFSGNNVSNFLATGICITVDLNHFFGIQCLEPITPLPSSQFPPNGGYTSPHTKC